MGLPVCPAGTTGGTNHYNVAGDDGRSVPCEFARDEVKFLVVVLLQINDAIDAEVNNRPTSMCMKSNELIADRNEVDAFVRQTISPVTDASS